MPRAILVLAAFLVPSAASAQTRPLREVERGAYVASEFGAVRYLNTPSDGPAATGAVFGVEAGVDILPTLRLGALAWAVSVGAPADYRGIDGDTSLDPNRARGDFQSLLTGASVRWAFLTFDDANGVDRTFTYVRAGAGLAFNRPTGVLDESGLFALGGLGVEYFTHLRHFSVGLEVLGTATLVDSGEAVGVGVLPHLRYTF